jgi:hypothetical protein
VPFTKWIAFKNLMARTCPVLLVLWVTLVLGLASAAVAGPAENLIDADPAQENRCRAPGILIALNEVCGVRRLA